MLHHCELYIKQVISEKRKGLLTRFLKVFLRTISWGFRIGVFFRNWAFDRGLLRRYHPPVPVVISVGNIVAGGTGKTPVTQLLAQELVKQYSTAILSRGYRSPVEKFTDPIMLSKGEGPIYPPSLCGDEPYLLSQNLPSALVFVGKNRHKSSTMASRAGAKIIILDDGMQHRQIARDFEVVVLNAQDLFGKGYFLPRGFLRDNIRSLSRSHLVVLNHIKNHEHFLKTKARLSKYTSSPVVTMELKINNFCDLAGSCVESIKGKRVGIFCGIGYPEHFKRAIQKQEAIIIDECIAPDHLTPSKEDLVHFAQNCAKKGADYLICTEKDQVKLLPEWKFSLPILWTKTTVAIVEGTEHWEAFLEKVKAKT